MNNFPNKKYKIIYVDPAWPYTKFSNDKIKLGNTKRRITPYRPLSLEDIKALPVNKIAEKDSVLLLWTTGPHNNSAIEVIKAWGFKYTTWQYAWLKRNKNIHSFHTGYGHYTGSNAELCILAKKGKGLPVLRHDIEQVYDGPVTEHSKKPDVFRQRTVQIFGDLPRIELFARTKIHGWDTWGNDEKLELKPLEAFLS